MRARPFRSVSVVRSDRFWQAQQRDGEGRSRGGRGERVARGDRAVDRGQRLATPDHELVDGGRGGRTHQGTRADQTRKRMAELCRTENAYIDLSEAVRAAGLVFRDGELWVERDGASIPLDDVLARVPAGA